MGDVGVSTADGSVVEAVLHQVLGGPSTQRHRVRIHLVGIGGAGLSAIAWVLHEQGYTVSGSDQRAGPATDALMAAGIPVAIGHQAKNVEGADLVLVSSAIAHDNIEVVTAIAHQLPVVKRAPFLGALLDNHTLIAVAGTHGKTTTTGMIASVLEALGHQPGYIVGSQVRALGRSAAAGAGRWFVIEADEYDHMFLGLHPQVAVVTNVEWDHPDCFPTPASFDAAFQAFAAQIRPDGWLVACHDDAGARALADWRRGRGGSVLTYGLDEAADFHADSVQLNEFGGCDAQVSYSGQYLGQLRLHVPGLHNLRNALAAVAAVGQLGIDPTLALPILADYRGAARRFEFKGEAAGVCVYDDYAHHPTEIRTTLAAARAQWPARTVWVVFQPHTYQRTQALWDDFTRAFGDAQHVLVTPIYAARDAAIPGVTGEALAAALVHDDARYVADARTAVMVLTMHLQQGDVLITLGAGDGDRIGEQLLDALRAGKITTSRDL